MLVRLCYHLRKPYSWLINFLLRDFRQPLPTVQTLQDVQDRLREVKWKVDAFGDWIQVPALTWGTRRGDCEDQAVLAQVLLKQIGIHGHILSVYLRPNRYSHAVCIFPYNWYTFYEGNIGCHQQNWAVFSNGVMLKEMFSTVKAVVEHLQSDKQLVTYILER